jgi:hypothetical protein
LYMESSLLSKNRHFYLENGVFITAFLFQGAWSSMMISNPDPKDQVISDQDPDQTVLVR